MTAFLADVGGLTRCSVVVMGKHYFVVRPKDVLVEPGPAAHVAGEDRTEMTCLCEVAKMGPIMALLDILAWETNEYAPLALVAQERVVH